MAVSFIGGDTQKKQPTCRMQLTNFDTYLVYFLTTGNLKY